MPASSHSHSTPLSHPDAALPLHPHLPLPPHVAMPPSAFAHAIPQSDALSATTTAAPEAKKRPRQMVQAVIVTASKAAAQDMQDPLKGRVKGREDTRVGCVGHAVSGQTLHPSSFRAGGRSQDRIPPEVEPWHTACWTCERCTFCHDRPSNVAFLACEICGEKRPPAPCMGRVANDGCS
uniref:Uncharacterized protein n=1 Tax=Haptolina ericina TaxID=156174 RepID=A0A7S3AXR6_9EUKA